MRSRPAAVLVCAAVLSFAACGGGGGEVVEPAKDRGRPAAPSGDHFPGPDQTGVPAGWKPKRTLTGSLVVRTPGAVVEDVLLTNADLVVAAPNVTIRRVKLQGGRIHNSSGDSCENGLVVEDTTIEPPAGQDAGGSSEGGLGIGGYTAKRVKIWRLGEGFRVSGQSIGCDPVRIEDSFASIVVPAGDCDDSHADGIQGYDGPRLTVTNTTIDFREAACGTAPFFVPDGQGNTSATVDRLLVLGGGFPFRLGVTATVSGLSIADGSWSYAPLDVKCELMKRWSARIVTVDRRYAVSTVRDQPCG
jgi:hypothetical protein